MRLRTLAAGCLAALSLGTATTAASATSTAPSAAVTKDPVIIVNGLTSPDIAQWPFALRLTADGYDATIFSLPGGGLQDIAKTAQALSPVVDQVLARTGASKVDLVGHSEGGVVARYYIKRLGGAAKVDSFVSLAGPQYGTYAGNLADFFGIDAFCQACEQMAIGSTFLTDLNAGPDVPAGVATTTFRTIYDLAVRPVDNAKLQDGATNVLVQDQCWFNTVGHSDLSVNGAVYTGIRQALRHEAIDLNCWAL